VNALLLASALVVAPAQQAPDTITPTFDWTAGTVLEASITLEQVQGQDGQTQPGPAIEATARRTIADHPQGLLVTSTVDGQQGSANPPFVVSDDGDFLGVEGVEQMVSRMREQMLAGVRAQTGGTVPPEAEAMADQMFTAESLEASVREEHQLLVGFWADRTWDLNGVQMTRTATQDGLTQAIVPTDVELSWKGYAACAPGEAPESCIELQAELFPDANAVATSFESLLTAQNPGAVIVNRATIERTVRILAHPESLVPRLVEDVTNATFDIESEGEIVELTLDVTERTTFTVGGGLR